MGNNLLLQEMKHMKYNQERLEDIIQAQHEERNPRDQQIYCPKCDVEIWIHKKYGKLCRLCGFSRTEILHTLRKSELKGVAI